MSTKKQNITALTTAIITPVKVFIGIDYHKRYSVYHVLDEAGKDVAIPPSLPDARPSSDRFRCAGRESKFLAVTWDTGIRSSGSSRDSESTIIPCGILLSA